MEKLHQLETQNALRVDSYQLALTQIGGRYSSLVIKFQEQKNQICQKQLSVLKLEVKNQQENHF